MASVSLEPKIETEILGHYPVFQQLQLTWHELLLLFIEGVHYNVVTSNVQQRVILINQVQTVLDICVHSKKVTCVLLLYIEIFKVR